MASSLMSSGFEPNYETFGPRSFSLSEKSGENVHIAQTSAQTHEVSGSTWRTWRRQQVVPAVALCAAGMVAVSINLKQKKDFIYLSSF